VRTAQESVHLIAATVGFISFYLLWLAVMFGLFLRNGWALTRVRHSTLQGTHQMVASLGLCLAVVHAFAQLAAPGGPVRLVDEFVPLLNTADPLGIGLGVVALELLVATALSALIQRKLGYSRWRALHGLTHAAFLVLAGHVLFAGSDSGHPLAWISVLAAVAVAVLAWIASTAWLTVVRRRLRSGSAADQREHQSEVHVDPQRCARFGFCEQAAPEVFKLRTDGRLAYRAGVSDDEIDGVIQAIEICPARAIALHRSPTSVISPPPPPEPEEVGSGVSRIGTVTGLRRPRQRSAR
jgi:sulfoxide reductase heme-binding subunit YedZ